MTEGETKKVLASLAQSPEFRMEKCKIKARKRKLKAEWTLDPPAKMVSMYGAGVKKMLDKMIKNQILEDTKRSYGEWAKSHQDEDRGFTHFRRNVHPTLERLRTL
jgi:hypothetical protein